MDYRYKILILGFRYLINQTNHFPYEKEVMYVK